MTSLRKALLSCLLAVCCMAASAQQAQDSRQEFKTAYMQLNPTVMQVYHELDSIFPWRFLANESPADCGYWVNYAFSSEKEMEIYKPWVESLIQRIKEVETYDVTEHKNDSAGVYTHSIQGDAVTPNSMQKDMFALHLLKRGVAFHYRARIEGEDYRYYGRADDANGQPRQDIADAMDALLDKYTKRRGVRKEAVNYDASKTNYAFVSFCSNKDEAAAGFRYIVPDCTQKDFETIKQAIKSYSGKAPVRTSCNDVYWQYEEAAICIIRPDKQPPLMVGAALKGSDLYLLRIEGKSNCFMPRAWAENVPIWKCEPTHKLTARKPLAPPATE